MKYAIIATLFFSETSLGAKPLIDNSKFNSCYRSNQWCSKLMPAISSRRTDSTHFSFICHIFCEFCESCTHEADCTIKMPPIGVKILHLRAPKFEKNNTFIVNRPTSNPSFLETGKVGSVRLLLQSFPLQLSWEMR